MDGRIPQGFGATTGTNTYAVVLSVKKSELVVGGEYTIDFINASTGASTVNIDSIGAVPALNQDESAIGAGDLNGKMKMVYDGTSLIKLAPNTVAGGVIGGIFCSSSATTNVLNGTYALLADTTIITPVSNNVAQDANWTLEYTGTESNSGILQFNTSVAKTAGGGKNYDFALFKNNVLIPESELENFKLESDGKGRSVVITVPVDRATSDLFTVKVAGNGTTDDVTCSGGTLLFIN